MPFCGRLLKNIVQTYYLLRNRLGIWFQNDGAVKSAKPCPENRIVAWYFGGAIESFERSFFIAGGEKDLKQSLVAINFLRIQGDGFVGEFDRLIDFLQILSVDKSQLQIRLGRFRMHLDCVL